MVVFFMADMPDEPDRFQGVPRKRKHPYDDWFIGRPIRINNPQDFTGKTRNVIAAALRYAERSNFAAAAAPCLDKNGQPGSVMIWGDKNREWSEGTPAEIKKKFLEANVKLRR